ncbi:MAG: asparagine synthase (glutamine-hydrolyzing) [Bryobacterales bacterium]
MGAVGEWDAGPLLRGLADAQRHRGPDDAGLYLDPGGRAGLAHRRLSIIDRSAAAVQPMASRDGRLRISFNGEIYNYRELRRELSDYPFRTGSDTEVLLAAFERWDLGCLDRLVGMFAFLIWDEPRQRLVAVRDRFGVKPLYYHQRADGAMLFSSEIRPLREALGLTEPDAVAWARYLGHGAHEYDGRTFWKGVAAVEPGVALDWSPGGAKWVRWYDVAERSGPGYDERPDEEVESEYLDLLRESLRLRFRSDVPVGVNLSGGVDSSLLLSLIHDLQGADSEVKAFTFITGDAAYDETPWVKAMLERTSHPWFVCPLRPEETPALAEDVQLRQDEPYGGLPTLAYAKVFERARAEGVIVLLDGQGMDEQWAGYDYYAQSAENAPLVQGSQSAALRPDCLHADFRAKAERFQAPRPFADRLRNLQYRDLRYSKLPRALRYNDRVSMRASTELREPFLDHRLVELALRQPPRRKIHGGVGKATLRKIAQSLLPRKVSEAPKRPVQTPQREWLRGPLTPWADAWIERALRYTGGVWLDAPRVRKAWSEYRAGHSDNSFYIWQWISLGMILDNRGTRTTPPWHNQQFVPKASPSSIASGSARQATKPCGTPSPTLHRRC